MPLDPKHVVALQQLKQALTALQNATATPPQPVAMLIANVDAELMSFYESVLGITKAK